MKKARADGSIVKGIVIRCYSSKNIFGHIIPLKGVDEDRFSVNLVVQAVAWLGHVRIIVKSDNEKSLISLVNKALTTIKCTIESVEKVTAEQSALYDSQSNGGTEVGVKILRGQFRTLKLCLESRIGHVIPVHHPIVPWLLEHAALLHASCMRGEDGLTPWARARGRPFGQRLIGFGEKIHWKPPLKGPQHDADGNMGPRLRDGIFLGYKRSSNSYVVADERGNVVESRAVQRRPMEQRWDRASIESLTTTPWNLRETADAKRVELGEEAPKHDVAEDKVPVPRRLKITMKLLRQLGTTDDCPQCEHVRQFNETKNGLAHTEKCRKRLVEALEQTEEGATKLANTEERINRGVARVIEESDARRESVRPSSEPLAHDAEEVFMRSVVGHQVQPEKPAEPEFISDLLKQREKERAENGTKAEVREVDPDAEMIGCVTYDQELMGMMFMLGSSTKSYQRENRAARRRLVAEMYSPPRVTRAISAMPSSGLLAGFALDVTCIDPDDGLPWDFDNPAKRAKAEAKIDAEQPMVLIGSVMCTAFCLWQKLNALKRDPELVRRELVKARLHLDFMMRMYRKQHEAGRLFLHEHPKYATSWQEKTVEDIMQMKGVSRVDADQCQYGSEVMFGKLRGEPVRKPTGFMSNGPKILEALDRKCAGKLGSCSRRKGGKHVIASGRVARDAARYSPELCKAIIRGISNELLSRGILKSGEVGMHAVTDDEEVTKIMKSAATGYSGKYKDDLTGQLLKDSLVQEAREVELRYFESKGVWTKVPRQHAFARTGRPPITVRWVDVNKGDDINPRYRSRLVARQMKAMDSSGESFFAPTPPLESLRMVLSMATSSIGPWRVDRDPCSERRTQISLIDISRAYFNAKVDEDVPTFVALPPEDADHGVLCAKLLRHMYGTRAAADGWQEECSSSLVERLGFVQGVSCPCVFRHSKRPIVVTVHGDDFTSVGSKPDLDWFENAMRQNYELTAQPRMGPGPEDSKEGLILNRVVRYTEDGLEYEADPRQAEKLILECGLAGGNTAATPGVRLSFSETEEDKPLRAGLRTAFRGSAARGNYLAADRIDVQFAAKEVCRWMAHPTEQSWAALKRLCRYLVGLPRLVYTFRWQEVEAIDVYTDTDWAGCPRTRKSTSGGCVMVGRHAVKSWSSTQSSVALSSGEAEFNGVVRGSGIGLGCQSLMRDLGVELPIRVWTDSSAAIGICTRQGLGKLRHLDTHTLWVQQAVRTGAVDLRKVLGEVNPADLFTKHSLSRERLAKLVELFDCKFLGGRAESAPETRVEATKKVTMADINEVISDTSAPYMPHTLLCKEDLDKRFPSIEVPEAVDAGDPHEGLVDPIFEAGMDTVSKLLKAMGEQGRKRHLREPHG